VHAAQSVANRASNQLQQRRHRKRTPFESAASGNARCVCLADRPAERRSAQRLHSVQWAYHHKRSRKVFDIAGQLREALVGMDEEPAVERIEELSSSG
jgi:hypothetical protein